MSTILRSILEQDSFRRLFVDRVGVTFNLCLRRLAGIENRFEIRPLWYVRWIGPMLRQHVHIGALFINACPNGRPLGLEYFVPGQHPAAQARQ